MLFKGAARCTDCHSGSFQTDHRFHAIAMPQIGPGKGDGWDATYWRLAGMKAFVEDKFYAPKKSLFIMQIHCFPPHESFDDSFLESPHKIIDCGSKSLSMTWGEGSP